MASTLLSIDQLYDLVSAELLTSGLAFSSISLNYHDQIVLITAHPSSKNGIKQLLTKLGDSRIKSEEDDGIYEFINQ